MTVIDCRFRPLTPEFECYITPEPANFWVTQTRPLKPEPLETTMKYFRKMGITGAVAPGATCARWEGPTSPTSILPIW